MNRTTHAIAAVAIAAAAVLCLAACSATAAATPAPTSTAAAQGDAGRGAGGFGPGVSGTVAAVTGSTAQVQSRTQQTAVTWTATTTFTAQQKTTATALAVGACVIARSAAGTVPTAGAAMAAATVEIMPAAGSSCRNGSFGGRPSGRPAATPRPRPSFTPPAGRGNAFPRPGAVAFGTVASLGTDSFTVKPLARTGTGTTMQKVTWSGGTAFTTLATSTAAAVTVGVCVSAQGTADSTGAVTARSIAISQPVNGTCGGGFGGFGGFGRGGGRGSAGTGASSND